MTDHVSGVDLSRYNNPINFQTLEPQIDFAFFKAMEGKRFGSAYWRDYAFLDNVLQAHRHSLTYGPYVFYRDEADPAEFVGQYYKLVDPERYGGELADALVFDLPVMLDVEVESVTPEKLRDTLDLLGEFTGHSPIIYTSARFWNAYDVSVRGWASEFDLWVAHYGVPSPTIPAGWEDYTFWQHTSSGPASQYGVFGTPGIDLNWFNGSQTDFLWYLQRVADPSLPRIPFKKLSVIIDPSVSEEQTQAIAMNALNRGVTATKSYDSPGWGDVHIYGVPSSERAVYHNWFRRNYPRIEEIVFFDVE